MNNRKSNTLILFLLISFFTFFYTGCKDSKTNYTEDDSRLTNHPGQEYRKARESQEMAVEAPPFTEGIFPCSDWHSYMESNPARRELEYAHEEISVAFDHGSENRWCLDCHDETKRDSLRMANGELLDFKESYKLCGQCHGVKLRDWRVGVHGKRTGEWNGQKEYLLCVHCHDPHSPRFKEMIPEPPPVSQESIRYIRD